MIFSPNDLLQMIFYTKYNNENKYELKDEIHKLGQLFGTQKVYFLDYIFKDEGQYYFKDNVDIEERKRIMDEDVAEEVNDSKERFLNRCRNDYQSRLYREAIEYYVYDSIKMSSKNLDESNEFIVSIFDIIKIDINEFLYDRDGQIPVVILAMIIQIYHYIIKKTGEQYFDSWKLSQYDYDFSISGKKDVNFEIQFFLNYIAGLEEDIKISVIKKIYQFCYSDVNVTVDNLNEGINESRIQIVDTFKDGIGLSHIEFNPYMNENFEIDFIIEIKTNADTHVSKKAFNIKGLSEQDFSKEVFSRAEKLKKPYKKLIMNLIMIMGYMDGSLAQSEKDYYGQIGMQLKYYSFNPNKDEMTSEEIEKLLKEIDFESFKIVFFLLGGMMMADKHIDENEADFLITVVKETSFDNSQIKNLFEMIGIKQEFLDKLFDF